MVEGFRHTRVNKYVKSAELNEWILDSLNVESEFVGIRNDPYSRGLEEYKAVFDNDIEQLANKYELKIGKKGYILDDIREKWDVLPLGRANGSRFKGMIRKEIDTEGSVQKDT
ncbi:hypothetical protein Tco_0394300 [Tanacetum coccineum]